MTRTREFDINETLDRAMHLFWQKGYVETSVRDLVEHTGVAHAGLYAAFGDKEGLFKAAVRKYFCEITVTMFGSLERSDAGRAEIEAVFETILAMNEDGRLRNGCMLVNSAIEFAGADDEVNNIVLGNFKKLVNAFDNALTHAVAAGDVRVDLPVRQTAVAITTTIHGLAVLSRTGLSITTIEEVIRATIEQLD